MLHRPQPLRSGLDPFSGRHPHFLATQGISLEWLKRGQRCCACVMQCYFQSRYSASNAQNPSSRISCHLKLPFLPTRTRSGSCVLFPRIFRPRNLHVALPLLLRAKRPVLTFSPVLVSLILRAPNTLLLPLCDQDEFENACNFASDAVDGTARPR